MTHIVFCCDAGPARGIGHLMRCIALAEDLAARGVVCTFVADLADVPWARTQVTSRGFKAHQHDDGRTGRLEAVVQHNPDGVVLDWYDAPPAFSAGLRSAGIPVLAIIDGDSRGQTGDLYLDQNLDAEHADGPGDAPRLAGLAYAMLRSEVIQLRPPAPPTGVRAVPPRVLAYFGGTDAHGASPVMVAALAASGEPFDAVVVAPRPDLRLAIERVPLAPGQMVTPIEPTDSLMSIAARADVVMSASGTSLWELLCIGSAAAVIWVVDNQELGYNRVVKSGLAAGVGHLDDVSANPTAASATLGCLLRDVAWRDQLRREGWALTDGRGRERVAAALLEMGDRGQAHRSIRSGLPGAAATPQGEQSAEARPVPHRRCKTMQHV